MSQLMILDTPIDSLKIVLRQRLGDERGFLSRLFCGDELMAAGWKKPIAQINHTLTRKKGTVRGLHFQHSPHAEMKLVTCLRGKVWDVAVDLRNGSPSFLHWYADTLSPGNGRALLIPEGFAHGFQALTEDCELLYCHSSAYIAQSEGAINAADPRLQINWPHVITELSARDKNHPMLTADFQGIHV